MPNPYRHLVDEADDDLLDPEGRPDHIASGIMFMRRNDGGLDIAFPDPVHKLPRIQQTTFGEALTLMLSYNQSTGEAFQHWWNSDAPTFALKPSHIPNPWKHADTKELLYIYMDTVAEALFGQQNEKTISFMQIEIELKQRGYLHPNL